MILTHKQLEMHGCICSNVAVDALVLKHQAISTHNADKFVLYQANFMQIYCIYNEQYEEI